MAEEELSRTKAIRPETAEPCVLRVVRREQVSPGFVRITVAGADDAFDRTFAPMGFDQWFRLFLPSSADAALVLPHGDAEGWYTRWLAMDEAVRPVIRNYTIRRAHRVDGSWEVDVDFVVHRSPESGLVEGVAASWALAAQPGDLLGMLDQGVLFNATGTTGTIVVAADETGLPAAEGIAGSLPAGSRAVLILEIAHEEDRRALPTVADVETVWAVREDAHALPGRAALALVEQHAFAATDYVYAVGEASFVLDARRTAQEAGVPKREVDFCAYWRPERRTPRKRASTPSTRARSTTASSTASVRE